MLGDAVMCGIFGIYNIGEACGFDELVFGSALMKMRHRGPDASGIKSFNKKAILGHVRLSIIDLKVESNQPFQLDNRYWLVYNGEMTYYCDAKGSKEHSKTVSRLKYDLLKHKLYREGLSHCSRVVFIEATEVKRLLNYAAYDPKGFWEIFENKKLVVFAENQKVYITENEFNENFIDLREYKINSIIN